MKKNKLTKLIAVVLAIAMLSASFGAVTVGASDAYPVLGGNSENVVGVILSDIIDTLLRILTDFFSNLFNDGPGFLPESDAELQDRINADFYKGNGATFQDAAQPDAQWHLGYANKSLIPADYDNGTYYIGGYIAPENGFTNVVEGIAEIPGIGRDDMKVRAMALSDGTGKGTVLFAVVDCIGITNADIKDIRALLAEGNYAKDHNITSINIASTHTHSCIDTEGLWTKNIVKIVSNGILNGTNSDEELQQGTNPAYMAWMKEVVASTLKKAYEDMKPGELTYTTKDLGQDYFNNKNRPSAGQLVELDEKGNLKVTGEKEIAMTNIERFIFTPDDETAKPTMILNLAAHPDVAGLPTSSNSGREISGDYIFYCGQYLEKAGFNFMFFQGAIAGIYMARGVTGDTIPTKQRVEESQRFGYELARIALSLTSTEAEIKANYITTDGAAENDTYITGEKTYNQFIDELGTATSNCVLLLDTNGKTLSYNPTGKRFIISNDDAIECIYACSTDCIVTNTDDKGNNLGFYRVLENKELVAMLYDSAKFVVEVKADNVVISSKATNVEILALPVSGKTLVDPDAAISGTVNQVPGKDTLYKTVKVESFQDVLNAKEIAEHTQLIDASQTYCTFVEELYDATTGHTLVLDFTDAEIVHDADARTLTINNNGIEYKYEYKEGTSCVFDNTLNLYTVSVGESVIAVINNSADNSISCADAGKIKILDKDAKELKVIDCKDRYLVSPDGYINGTSATLTVDIFDANGNFANTICNAANGYTLAYDAADKVIVHDEDNRTLSIYNGNVLEYVYTYSVTDTYKYEKSARLHTIYNGGTLLAVISNFKDNELVINEGIIKLMTKKTDEVEAAELMSFDCTGRTLVSPKGVTKGTVAKIPGKLIDYKYGEFVNQALDTRNGYVIVLDNPGAPVVHNAGNRTIYFTTKDRVNYQYTYPSNAKCKYDQNEKVYTIAEYEVVKDADDKEVLDADGNKVEQVKTLYAVVNNNTNKALTLDGDWKYTPASGKVVKNDQYTVWYKDWVPATEVTVEPFLNIYLKQVEVPVTNTLIEAVGKLNMANYLITVDKSDVKVEYDDKGNPIEKPWYEFWGDETQYAIVTEIGYMELGNQFKTVFLPGEIVQDIVAPNGASLHSENSVTAKDFSEFVKNKRTSASAIFGDDVRCFGLMNDAIGYVVPDNDYTMGDPGKHYHELISLGQHVGSALIDGLYELAVEVGRLA